MTTQTPSPIANWDEMFPYISFLAGGLSSAMCVVSGLGLVMFLNAVQPETVGEIRTSLTAPLIGMTGAIWLANNALAKASVLVGIMGIIVTFLVVIVSLY